MPLQQINLGTYANDGTGDDLRTAFQKVNANFAALNGSVTIAGARNIGAGVGLFNDVNGVNLEFKTVTSIDGTIVITAGSGTVDLSASSRLQNDPNPTLKPYNPQSQNNANLNLNGNFIYGGDTKTTVYNIDVQKINGLISLLISNKNTAPVDLGSIALPAGGTGLPGDSGILLDFGYFTDANSRATVADFGSFF